MRFPQPTKLIELIGRCLSTSTSLVRYVSTPILFVAVARTILKERSAVAGGVLTPAAALGKTALLDDLNHEHKVRFAVVEK